ncbi:MAG TPA: phospholipase D-like domain-containing protein [Roseiflexaceae bacterium]|nr:phospholipase D-like domain-containing protein [Roseiflexaceae bacterium]
MYDFGRASVRDALIAAQGRGVDVRIVAESDAVEDPSDGPFYGSLMSAGIPVISDTLSSLQHNKFAIFDSAVTWTGSVNWSDSDFTRNGNNVLVITDTVVASIYATEFEEMFGGSFSNSKTDNTAHSALVGDSRSRSPSRRLTASRAGSSARLAQPTQRFRLRCSRSPTTRSVTR